MSRRQAKAARITTSARTAADVLIARRAEILKAWSEAQLKGELFPRELISAEELQGACGEVMGALVETLASGREEIEAPAYERLRELVGKLSRGGAAQGFSPTQTVNFCISLKDSIHTALQREFTAQPELLNRELLRVSSFFEKLQLIIAEKFVAAREEVLRHTDAMHLQRTPQLMAEVEEHKRLEEVVQKHAHELEQRVREVEEERRKLRLLSRRLVRVQEEERRRLARELHDELGQLLTAIRLNLSFLQQPAPESAPGTRATRLQEALALTDQCLEQVRNLCYLLRPPLLEEAGLLSAVRWFLQRYAQHTGIEVVTDLPEVLPRLPQEAEVALFRVIQEGMTNIARHAESKVAHVRLALDNHGVTLVIADAGRGFDLEKLLQAVQPGVGLVSMQERIRELGGELRVESAPGKGTKVIVNLPLPAREG